MEGTSYHSYMTSHTGKLNEGDNDDAAEASVHMFESYIESRHLNAIFESFTEVSHSSNCPPQIRIRATQEIVRFLAYCHR
jgi:hypothetical protein